MARKWIFSCFLILGILKAIESGKLTTDLAKQQQQFYMYEMELNKTNANTKNLTAITWAHAVNSQKELNSALGSDIEMIEADIILGKLINDPLNDLQPVMGHPPATKSDISLDSFLRQILDYNKQTEKKKKGVKLDFKSTEVFEGSIEILKKLWPLIYINPLWLNADIIMGPVNATKDKPVNPKRFLDGCKEFNSATLSVGWTTRWGHNFTEGSYSDNHINEMLETIRENSITSTNHKITFPVRAGIAANSKSQLHHLVKELSPTNEVTLTIWSSHNDSVNIDKLRDLIFSFGLDRVYLDVPDEVSSKLNLHKSPPNGAVILSSSFASFSILSLCLVAVSFLFQY